MKDIKDYLPLYIGVQCEMGSEDDKRIKTLTGVDYGLYVYEGIFGFQKCAIELIKPILRKLSDMTDEEIKELASMPSGLPITISAEPTQSILNWADRTRYLLSRGFDLFNLIPEGLAIDKTTLKSTTP